MAHHLPIYSLAQDLTTRLYVARTRERAVYLREQLGVAGVGAAAARKLLALALLRETTTVRFRASRRERVR